jgi:hypothetical protein
MFFLQAVMETAFDAVYLISVIAIGISMIRSSRGNKQYLLFGIMAVTLGGGDAFHLIPRAYALCTAGAEGLTRYVAVLGTGKLITSVTMTVFYVLLYFVWRLRYKVSGRHGLTAAVLGLAAVRVALCFFPQNAWTSLTPPLAWGIYRNIPFAALGLLILVLFYKSAKAAADSPFRLMWLTVALSFAFYIPVVLFADAYPLVGVLMIPKTCAYLWAVIIGFNAMKKETIKEREHS